MEISDALLRHRAVQIASNLPSDPICAKVVLEYALEIVEKFFAPEMPAGAKRPAYPTLVPTSLNFRSSATESPSETPYQSQSVDKPSTD